MLSFFVVLTSGAFIQSPLHTPQLAKQHHARVLLPRAAPSAMVFDPGDQILVCPPAVVLGVVVYVPMRIGVYGTIDALMAVVTGKPLGLIRVEVRALLTGSPACTPYAILDPWHKRFCCRAPLCVLAAHARRLQSREEMETRPSRASPATPLIHTPPVHHGAA